MKPFYVFLLSIHCTLLLTSQAQPLPAKRNHANWPVYGSSNSATKYSPLDQINASNFNKLEIVWRWSSIDQPLLDADTSLHTWKNESTPLKIRNVLYTSTSLSQVAAIDARNGTTIWQYDPETYKSGTPPNMGFVHRGLAYWEKGSNRHVYIATGDAFLIALDANTGKPVTSFGDKGRIDLTSGLDRKVNRSFYGCTSPPLICNNVIIVGASILDFPMTNSMPPGDVRGFDAFSGKLLWTFRAVPRHHELGAATWELESWRNAGNTNVWTWMSCDEKLGYAYLPFSTPSNDFYGGQRHGDNLFAESVVAVNVKTGQRVWHYQTVHHGLWDYDLPAPPVLADVTINGKKRKIVAQVTKQGFVFVLDRITGRPVWPVLEQPVPASKIPGEKAALTQPFPTLPKAFEKQGIDTNDLIDFTPKLRALALDSLAKYDYGPLYTPPSKRGTVAVPGIFGGGSWAGAALDPAKGILYIPSSIKPAVLRLFLRDPNDPKSFAGYFDLGEFAGPVGLPLLKPPYGKITAIDLNTGQHVWMQPVGNLPASHPYLKHLNLKNLGSPTRNHVLLTKTLLLAAAEGDDVYRPSLFQDGMLSHSKITEPYLRAFDPVTGKLIGEILLPANASGAPVTYTVKGKQFIVIPVGGASQKAELIALALPDSSIP